MAKKSSSLFAVVICFGASFNSCTNAQNNMALTDEIKIDSVSENIIPLTFDSAASGLSFHPSGNYNTTKISMKDFRTKLKARYITITDSSARIAFLDSVSLLFSEKLLNDIIPYWYGTAWDFNGYTAIPNEGEIACGYFVSTTLRDMGVNLNRYKLAQKGGLQEAKSIAMAAENLYPSVSAGSIIEKLNRFSSGLYFVGLDYHVGFLYLKNGQRFFIHSNYYQDKVMAENADYSIGFSSSRYCFAKITGNHSLALSWLMEREVKIAGD